MNYAWVSLGCMLAVVASAGPATAADAEAAAHSETEASLPFLGGFLRETRIVYPLGFDAWSARDEHRYDDPRHGVSVRYVRGDQPDRWVDVYFYPVGVLSDDEVARVANNEWRGLQKMWIHDRGADGADMSGLRRYTFEPVPAGAEQVEAKPRKAFSVDLTYEREGDRRNSAMVVLYQQMYVLKTRYSVKHEGLSRHEVRKELESFTAELAKRVSISSTGGCWMPLPIEPLLPGQAIPEGSLLSMQTGAETTEYVYADRVLSRDPSSQGAQAAVLLGMAVLERVYPGCDGSEPYNPVVPADMREIRIEYRAPGEAAAPSGGPAVGGIVTG